MGGREREESWGWLLGGFKPSSRLEIDWASTGRLRGRESITHTVLLVPWQHLRWPRVLSIPGRSHTAAAHLAWEVSDCPLFHTLLANGS